MTHKEIDDIDWDPQIWWCCKDDRDKDDKLNNTNKYKMVKIIVGWFHEIWKVIKFLLIVSETEVETSP